MSNEDALLKIIKKSYSIKGRYSFIEKASFSCISSVLMVK
ncbi:hypothetical protein BTH41_04930 [Bacillus mycoides]|nr:hypothetical protein BTH41_04930 [Bacillus mycoides]